MKNKNVEKSIFENLLNVFKSHYKIINIIKSLC